CYTTNQRFSERCHVCGTRSVYSNDCVQYRASYATRIGEIAQGINVLWQATTAETCPSAQIRENPRRDAPTLKHRRRTAIKMHAIHDNIHISSRHRLTHRSDL